MTFGARLPASTAVERSGVLGEVAAAVSTNGSWATIAASRAGASSSVLPRWSRIAYVSVIMWSAAVRTAGSVISTRIATSGRVTWERIWWLSRRRDWISSASAPLRRASPHIHIVRRWSLAAQASAVTASRRSRRIVSPWLTRTDRSVGRS